MCAFSRRACWCPAEITAGKEVFLLGYGLGAVENPRKLILNEIRRSKVVNVRRPAPIIYHPRSASYDFAFAICRRMHLVMQCGLKLRVDHLQALRASPPVPRALAKTGRLQSEQGLLLS